MKIKTKQTGADWLTDDHGCSNLSIHIHDDVRREHWSKQHDSLSSRAGHVIRANEWDIQPSLVGTLCCLFAIRHEWKKFISIF